MNLRAKISFKLLREKKNEFNHYCIFRGKNIEISGKDIEFIQRHHIFPTVNGFIYFYI